MVKLLNKIIATSAIVTILLTTSPFAHAAEAPDANLNSTITNQINQNVGTININPNPQINPQSQPSNPSNDTNVANTGDDVDTSTSNNQNSSTDVNQTNDADVSQNTNAYAETGNNEAEKNIAINGNAGMITTGDAAINVTGVVSANNNQATVNGGGAGSGNTTNLSNTGSGITTTTSANGTDSLFISQGNTALIHQGTNAKASTGNNRARGNIAIGGIAGGIITGNASIDTNYLVAANGNVAIVGGTSSNGGPGSGASIYILNSGNMMNATSASNQNHYLVVTNENRALIAQTCGVPESSLGRIVNASSCISNTGGNDSSRGIAVNGDAGVIETGDAVVNVNMAAVANSNTTTVNNNGAGCGDTNTDMLNSGDDVTTTNSTNCNDSTTVNSENDATVRQEVNAKAITGNNTANRNIAINGNAGVIKTGNAIINVTMTAQVNDNNTTINEPSASLNSDANTTNIINTGDDVTTNTTNNNTTNVTVNTTNSLTLEQEVNADLNTGGNDVSDNLACYGTAGFIKTGDTTANINMAASGNSNEVHIGDPVLPTGAPSITPEPTTTLAEAVINTTQQPQQTQQQNNTGGGTGGSSVVSGVSYTAQTLAAATQKAVGKVLGARAKKLPASGAEDTVMLLSIITATFVLGRKLRTLELKSN